MTRPNILCGIGLGVATLLMAGCGDDPPTVAFRSSGPAASAGPATPPPSTTFVPPAPTGDDPQVAPDPLAANSGSLSTDAEKASQAMVGEDTAKTPAPDPSLLPTGPTDDLHQPWRWPTKYTHWLKVTGEDATVTTSINGVQIGGTNPIGSHDITMKLHRGSNWLTVSYKPHSVLSHADIAVLEGEHHPPLAPLVSFVPGPLADTPHASVSTHLQPITKTFNFIAH